MNKKSKLNHFKEKFLDTYIKDNKAQYINSFILIPNDTVNDDDFAEPFFEHDNEDNRLYINDVIRENFMNLFGLDSEEADEFIANWFANRFDVPIDYTA